MTLYLQFNCFRKASVLVVPVAILGKSSLRTNAMDARSYMYADTGRSNNFEPTLVTLNLTLRRPYLAVFVGDILSTARFAAQNTLRTMASQELYRIETSALGRNEYGGIDAAAAASLGDHV